MKAKPSYANSVFINCPFDKEYNEFFIAIVFTVYKCGFYPRCLKEKDDSTEQRIDKILNLIAECKYAVHDISRTSLDPASNLPRFNMPFELGMFLAAKRFGEGKHKSKNAVVFERNKYDYQKYISDLNGVDPKAHHNDVKELIKGIANWLKTSSGRTSIPGIAAIFDDYNVFTAELPKMMRDAGTDDDLNFFDLCACIEGWINDV